MIGTIIKIGIVIWWRFSFVKLLICVMCLNIMKYALLSLCYINRQEGIEISTNFLCIQKLCSYITCRESGKYNSQLLVHFKNGMGLVCSILYGPISGKGHSLRWIKAFCSKKWHLLSSTITFGTLLHSWEYK